MPKDTLFYPKETLNCRGRILDLSEPKIMGILNITPDSFYDGGKFLDVSAALKQAESMFEAGADILDIGAGSSRPGSQLTDSILEQERLLPVLKAIRAAWKDVFISVDTWNASTVKMVSEEGADIINDITAGSMDTEMFNAVAESKLPYILMHMQGHPSTMQIAPAYKDVLTEVMVFFAEKIAEAKDAGIIDIVLDPGFGFGKDLQHNYDLLNGLPSIRNLGFPILAGVSRKKMICELLGLSPKDALNGTTVLNTIALMNGAGILRVHDVKEAVEVRTIVKFAASNT